jgi:hypothetical protein
MTVNIGGGLKSGARSRGIMKDTIAGGEAFRHKKKAPTVGGAQKLDMNFIRIFENVNPPGQKKLKNLLAV